MLSINHSLIQALIKSIIKPIILLINHMILIIISHELRENLNNFNTLLDEIFVEVMDLSSRFRIVLIFSFY